MSERIVVIGVSLKMYLDPRRTAAWAQSVARIGRANASVRSGAVELFVLPALPSVPLSLELFRGTRIGVGAQDLHWDDRGAATGGVSGADLAQLGCRYVEINHAERRSVFGEDETVAARKLRAALRNDLVPVLCVGEGRRGSADDAVAVCERQLDAILGPATRPLGRLLVAYEPEWAIGADDSASPDHVRAVARGIRTLLDARPGIGCSSVLYGGSAGPGLLPRLAGDVDGLFLGRFAHDPAALEQVLDEAVEPAGV